MSPQLHPPDKGGGLEIKFRTLVILLVTISTLTFQPVLAQLSASCATNCASCYASGSSTSCMSCVTGYYLQTFQCVTACTTGYIVDTNDNICKRQRTQIDNPCSPSSYNPNTNGMSSNSCVSCLSGKLFSFWRVLGKYCESWALINNQNDCLAGFYCIGSSTLRSPVASYSLTSGNRYFTNVMGDICPSGTYCTAGSS